MSFFYSLKAAGRPVAYYPSLAKHVGGVNAAIFLCQLLYWDDKAQDQLLGVYKSSEEWEVETGLSYREQATARNKLKERGLIVETHKRLQHRIYFKINSERLDQIGDLIQCKNIENTQHTNEHSTNDENAFGGVRNSRSSNTENTYIDIKENIKRKGAVHADAFTETDFDSFWISFDKKVSKPAAEKSWQRIKPDKQLAEQIILKAEEYARSTPDKKYRKNPATWLNGRCWEDELIHGQVFESKTVNKFNALDAINGGDGYGNNRKRNGNGRVYDISGGMADEESKIKRLISD